MSSELTNSQISAPSPFTVYFLPSSFQLPFPVTVNCSPFTVHCSLFTVHCSPFCITNGKVSCCERSPSVLQTEGFHAVRGRLFHCKRNNPVANIVGLPYSQRYNLRIWNVIIPVFCLNNIRLRIVGLPMSGETNSYFQHGDNRYFLRYLRSTILRHLRGTFFSVKTCWLRTYVTPSGFRFRLCLPFFL